MSTESCLPGPWMCPWSHLGPLPTLLVPATLTSFLSFKYITFPPIPGLFRECVPSLASSCPTPHFLLFQVFACVLPRGRLLWTSTLGEAPMFHPFIAKLLSFRTCMPVYDHKLICVTTWSISFVWRTWSISPDNTDEVCLVSLFCCAFLIPAPSLVPDTRRIQWLWTCVTRTVKILKCFCVCW